MKDIERPKEPLQEVPSKNVLDLRSEVREVHPPEPRSTTLERFWKKHEPKPRSKRTAQAWVMRDVFSGYAMRVRALSSRARIGSFPIIAVAVLLLFTAAIGTGQVVTTKQRILSMAREGYESLKIAGAEAGALDLESSRSAFESAETSFASAQDAFGSMHPLTNSVVSSLPIAGSQLRSARHLVAAARLIARAGSSFTTIASPLAEKGTGFSNIAAFLNGVQRDRTTLDAIVIDVQNAADELSRVNARDVPAAYRTVVQDLQSSLPVLYSSVANLSDGIDVLGGIIGAGAPTEQLFIFQNSNELRPTGGFVGSFALLRLENGTFKTLDAPNRGTFDVDVYLPETVTPPKPLQVITPSWYFRDANWYPDFPTTAAQFVRFYRQARGFAPDGIIAFTPGVMQDLLAITGPVELPAYGVTIDADNFVTTAQDQVEKKYDLRTNDPKRFIVDLIPVLADRLSALPGDAYPALLSALARATSLGDLQIWSGDETVQRKIVDLGWSGSIPESDGDFLELVNTNVGGGKTDGVMTERIRDRVTVAPDGTATVTVDVTRTHGGTPSDAFTGTRNRTYHRFYVPRGSTFLSAAGFSTVPAEEYQKLPAGSSADALLASVEGRVVVDEASGTRINDEFGKTVFGNWTVLDPGETATFSVSYRLPFKINGTLQRYDLTVEKQAGAARQTLDFALTAPAGTKVVWNSVDGSRKKTDQYSYVAELSKSTMLSLVLQHK